MAAITLNLTEYLTSAHQNIVSLYAPLLCDDGLNLCAAEIVYFGLYVSDCASCHYLPHHVWYEHPK